MIKYISNKKSKWYFMKKSKDDYIYLIHNNKLKTFNFSISFISGLSDSDWNIWINLLDKIINENNKKRSHDI